MEEPTKAARFHKQPDLPCTDWFNTVHGIAYMNLVCHYDSFNIKNQCFHLELCFSKAKWHQIRRSNSIIANYTAKTDRDDGNGYRNYEHKYLIYEK